MSIVYDLIVIRLRKFLPIGDKGAVFLLLVGYLCTALLFYFNFDTLGNYIYLFFLDSMLYHTTRKDIELLKVRKNYKHIILCEYVIYGLAFLLVLVFKGELLWALAVIFLTYMWIVLRAKFTLGFIKYPFSLIDPFWHIYFRKYKIIYFLPLALVVSYMAIKHDNSNVQVFALLIGVFIACLPGFARERKMEICYSVYPGKVYLKKQLQNVFLQSLYIVLPFSVLLLLVWGVSLQSLGLILVICLFPVVNIICKYAFFDSDLKQQLFVLFIVIGYGIPLLFIPFLIKKAILNLETIKHVKN